MTAATTTYATPLIAGRIDELIETGIHLLREDTNPQAQQYLGELIAMRVYRRIDLAAGRLPRAPLSWSETLYAVAEWIGWY